MATNDSISIPLKMSVFAYAPMDGPVGSTPDPTDPNQFRATLTGSTLYIETQKEAVSYVVVQEVESENKNEDYFFELSFGSVSVPITHAGKYTIHIGYWKTDFTGYLLVRRFVVTDFSGRIVRTSLEGPDALPAGFYIIRLETSFGTTSTKVFKPL